MRYTVGQKLVVLFHELEGREHFHNPMYLPWSDKLKRLHIRTLVVTEHHKVPDAFAKPGVENANDGYLLTDEQGHVWANQYPVASYGQVSDEADRLFRRLHPEGTDYESLDDGALRIYALATEVLDTMRRGVRDLGKKPGYEKEAVRLQTHLDWVIQKIALTTAAVITLETFNQILGKQYTLSWPETPAV